MLLCDGAACRTAHAACPSAGERLRSAVRGTSGAILVAGSCLHRCADGRPGGLEGEAVVLVGRPCPGHDGRIVVRDPLVLAGVQDDGVAARVADWVAAGAVGGLASLPLGLRARVVA